MWGIGRGRSHEGAGCGFGRRGCGLRCWQARVRAAVLVWDYGGDLADVGHLLERQHEPLGALFEVILERFVLRMMYHPRFDPQRREDELLPRRDDVLFHVARGRFVPIRVLHRYRPVADVTSDVLHSLVVLLPRLVVRCPDSGGRHIANQPQNRTRVLVHPLHKVLEDVDAHGGFEQLRLRIEEAVELARLEDGVHLFKGGVELAFLEGAHETLAKESSSGFHIHPNVRGITVTADELEGLYGNTRASRKYGAWGNGRAMCD